MAGGLVDQAQAQEQALPTPGGQMPGAAAPVAATAGEAGSEEAATPEEQAAYDAALGMASELIYTNEESSDTILQMMGQGDPVTAVVDAAEFVMAEIEDTFKGQLPEATVIPIADEVTDLLMELGAEAGSFAMDEPTAIKIKGAVVRSLLDQYGAPKEEIDQIVAGLSEADIAEHEQMFGGA